MGHYQSKPVNQDPGLTSSESYIPLTTTYSDHQGSHEDLLKSDLKSSNLQCAACAEQKARRIKHLTQQVLCVSFAGFIIFILLATIYYTVIDDDVGDGKATNGTVS